MIRLLLLVAAALLIQVDGAVAQKRCVKGIPCGNTCIAATRTCRVESDSPARRAPSAATLPARLHATVPAEARFVASRRGRVFYARTCSAWRSLSQANLVWFSSAAEARAAGYEPSRSRGCGVDAPAPARGASATSPAQAPAVCVLARVVDGDTVACADGTRVRLLLIDTPEMDQGPYGIRARQYLMELVPAGTAMKVAYDIQLHDRYGRTLAYLFTPDGRMVNEEVARAGYAVVSIYPPNVKHVDRMRAAVEQARSARVGLWETSAFECSPADHRADRCE